MQIPIQTLKRFANVHRWQQLAVVLFAGLLMIVTTACGVAQATPPTGTNPNVGNVPRSESMYPYKDTQRDTRAADAKAERMIREANQRIQQNSGQSLGDQVDDLGQAAQQATENIGKSTQRAAQNAADNARELVNGAANTVDQLTPGR